MLSLLMKGNPLIRYIEELKLRPGEISVIWLGQAGFLIQTAQGSRIAIDPYLSDCVERLCDFKRITPRPVDPEDLNLDVLISTHQHPDHFDVDAVPVLMKRARRLYANPAAADLAWQSKVDRDKIVVMRPGEKFREGSFVIHAVYADHGPQTPDAVGVILELEGKKLYFVGDTCECPEVTEIAINERPDVIFPPINGAFGNLDAAAAARLVGKSKAPVAVPCHFWTFFEHGGDPQHFVDCMKKEAPATKVLTLSLGEGFII
jgi:L-ascorbate 6-phosphate lactonase